MVNRQVEPIREALGHERCACGMPAAVVWRITQDGTETTRKTCARDGEALRQDAARGSGGGAILP